MMCDAEGEKRKNDGLQELIYQKSAPGTYKLSSAISGNGSWCGDLEYFTKNVLFITLEESVAQVSLALQKIKLVSVYKNSNTVFAKLIEKGSFHEWMFSAGKVT